MLMLIGLIAAGSGHANVLCSDWRPEVTDRLDETTLTQDSYLNALRGLEMAASDDGIDPWPFLVIVEGFLLKKSALTENDPDMQKLALKNYCEFVVVEGRHQD